jgi:hypothetical protein
MPDRGNLQKLSLLRQVYSYKEFNYKAKCMVMPQILSREIWIPFLVRNYFGGRGGLSA